MRQPPTIDQIASLKCVQDEVLAKDGSCQYRPKERLPVWHTDGTFKETPEAGHAGLSTHDRTCPVYTLDQ